MAKTNDNSLTKSSILFEMPVFENADMYVQFPKDNTDIGFRRRLVSFDEPNMRGRFQNGEADTLQFKLPIHMGSLQSVLLPPGLTIISGGSGAGKTDFMRELAKVIKVNRVLAVEPQDYIEELVTHEFFNSADSALIHLVRCQLQGLDGLPVLDSLREPLFEINGPAGDKGIINAFFTAVTRVSNALAMNGLTVVATVNPMNQDEAYMTAFLNKLSSSVPGFINLKSRATIGGSTTFSGTIAMRPDRVARNFTFSASRGNGTVGSAAEPVVFEARSADVDTFRLTAGERNLVSVIAQDA